MGVRCGLGRRCGVAPQRGVERSEVPGDPDLPAQPFTAGVRGEELSSVIPENAPVSGVPELAIPAREAGVRKFHPLPWFPERATILAEEWLLLDAKEFASPIYVDPNCIAARQVVFAGDAFPDAGPFRTPIVVLGPAR